WEGRRWSEIERVDADPYHDWMAHWQTLAPPEGEALGVFETRVRRWHDSLDLEATHLLVAHAGVVRALRVLRHGVDWTSAMREAVPSLTWLPM
ncbi:MAG: histidine phosphatase family protein, partial [Polyangiales bacterium]